MDFTREPIIETIITPREGFRLIVRNSKTAGQEEFLVDAIEVISFGSSCFFRNQERSTPFIVPVTDYEVVEVREPRLALKAASFESTVRNSSLKDHFKPTLEKKEHVEKKEHKVEEPAKEKDKESVAEEPKVAPEERDRRRDKRRNSRRRKGGRDEQEQREGVKPAAEEGGEKEPVISLLPPPATLIRDDAKVKEEAQVQAELRAAAQLKLAATQQENHTPATVEHKEPTPAPVEMPKPAPIVPPPVVPKPLIKRSAEEEQFYTATPATDDEEWNKRL